MMNSTEHAEVAFDVPSVQPRDFAKGVSLLFEFQSSRVKASFERVVMPGEGPMIKLVGDRQSRFAPDNELGRAVLHVASFLPHWEQLDIDAFAIRYLGLCRLAVQGVDPNEAEPHGTDGFQIELPEWLVFLAAVVPVNTEAVFDPAAFAPLAQVMSTLDKGGAELALLIEQSAEKLNASTLRAPKSMCRSNGETLH